MCREVVPSGAYRAAPVFESKVYLTMRVQHGLALLAKNRLVFDDCEVFNVFEGCVDGTHGQNYPGLGQFIGRPVVPRESKTVLELSLVEVHIINITIIS